MPACGDELFNRQPVSGLAGGEAAEALYAIYVKRVGESAYSAVTLQARHN